MFTTPLFLDSQVPVTSEALLIETLESAAMNSVAHVTSSATRLERTALDGCCGLPYGHGKGHSAQHALCGCLEPDNLAKF